MSAANLLQQTYNEIRREDVKALLVVWSLSVMLSISGGLFKSWLFPQRHVPPVGSTNYQFAVWFVTGIDGLFSAFILVTMAASLAGIIGLIAWFFDNQDYVLVFLYSLIPFMALLFLIRMGQTIEMFRENIDRGLLFTIGPAMLNETVFWFYLGVAIFFIYNLVLAENRYLRGN